MAQTIFRILQIMFSKVTFQYSFSSSQSLPSYSYFWFAQYTMWFHTLRAVPFPLFGQLVLSLFPATFPGPLIIIDKTQILYSQWSVWGSHSYWSTFFSIPPWYSVHVINYYHPFNFIPIFQPRIREGNPGAQHKQAWHTISNQCYFITLSSLMYSNKSSPSSI